MSNAPKPKGKPNSLDRYRAEVKGEPFVLWLTNEERLEIPRPSGNQMLDAEEAVQTGTSRDVLRAVCGDKADALLDVLGEEDAHVLQAVARDIQEAFGLGN